ncbi:RNA-binding domain-containing protein [Artomyces pyxidatus]|uniref:RNA-binding domain-containing protein n=1 Tax=Artomyces pyxidatus TaxID=48021 RepID=A0ACB8SSW8_9AGAM|nr:RNA-binding domain-containing protein [Artomyces pyxidatus]
MDALPTAPAARGDDDRGDRRGGRDDFLSSRPDRQAYPPREDLPLPTQAPYTAFVGNLAFDLTEADLESFFGGLKVKSVKVIKDRDERPKGFGYVEFEELDDLKGALALSQSSLSGRQVRISVAEPPKERGGFGGGFGADDAKFSGEWRRQGPLPDLPTSRDSSRRRFDGPPGAERERPPPSMSDNASDWRSNRSARASLPEAEPPRRKGPGFFAGDGAGAADKEETWTIGGKFKPSADDAGDGQGRKFGGGFRARGEMGPPADNGPTGDSDWRTGPRPGFSSRSSTSPTSSTPPTPQLTRRKLELLPRSGTTSGTPSPLASPKMAQNNAHTPRANPFGTAKPVDVSAKEKAVTERLDKEREATKERLGQHSMSRNSSRTGSDRANGSLRTPPASASGNSSVPPSPRVANAVAANVRPTFSFAAAAGSKKVEGVEETGAEDEPTDELVKVDEVSEQLGEVTI